MNIRATLFALTLLLPVPLASAITIRHDRSDSQYTDLANAAHPYGGRMQGSGFYGSGTLISPNWVLTARHVLSGNITFVNSAGSFSVVEQVRHPTWDIGLARLASPISNIDPVKLYSLDFGVEDGQEAIILGAGNTGTGNTGQQGGTGGARRAAQTNVHANADAWGWGSHRLLTWFRSPTGSAATLEGGSASGDSGGALLLDVDGEYAISGVLSLAWWGGNGGDAIGKYNTGGVFVRSAPVNDWILQHATNAVVIADLPDSTDFEWIANFGGSWHTPSNWSPAGIPDGNDNTVQFTGSNSSITNVTLSAPATVREIVLDASSSYRLFGNGSLNLDADTAGAQVTVTGGKHFFWLAGIDVDATTTIDIAAGAELSFGSTLDLNGRTITKRGPGALYIDGQAGTNGSLFILDGFLKGDGSLGGSVTNLAGVLSPGREVGQLAVNGHVQGRWGTLQIDIAGAATGQYDHLLVSGNASLDGSLEAVLMDGFFPQPGQQFQILSAGSVFNNGLALGGPSADLFRLLFTGNSLSLEALFDSDFDKDGDVDGFDFVRWQIGFGDFPSGGASRFDGDADGDGDVDGDDFLIWQQQYGSGAGRASLAVPEPATLWLLVLAIAASLRRRRP